LLVDRPYSDVDAIAAQVASAARSVGRPVAAALTVPAADRDRLSRRWKVIGLDAIDQTTSSPAAEPGSKNRKPVVQIDTPAVLSAAVAVENWRGGREAHPATDPVNEYFLSVLECPRMLTSGPRTSAQLASLDSLCNLR
jgi:hypothetical protein